MKNDAGAIRSDKIKSLGTLMLELISHKKIYYIPLTRKQLKEFMIEGPHFQFAVEASLIKGADQYLHQLKDALQSAATSVAEGAPTDLNSQALAFSLAIDNPEEENLSFFYLSDLVDIVLAKIELTLKELPGSLKEELDPSEYNADDLAREIETLQRFEQNFERFRIVLGPIELITEDKVVQTSCLGDIPISTKYFMEWLTSKISQKDEVIYTLSAFLTDLVQNLLRNFMNDDGCFTPSVKQKIRLNTAVVTSYKEGEYDEFTERIVADSPDSKRLYIDKYDLTTNKKPLLNISGEFMSPVSQKGITEQMNYLIYSAGRLKPPDLMTGDRTQDEAAGIFHYMIGKRNGIVKTINLTKTQVNGLKEVRFQTEGYDGLQQLREVYDVEVNTFANVNTFPGTYIYVDPKGFAPNTTNDEGILDLTQYGIGGYHMIIRSTHTFGEGKADSQITAQWVSPKEVEDEGCSETASASGDGSASKCHRSAADASAIARGFESAAAEATYTSDMNDEVSRQQTSLPILGPSPTG